MASRLGISCLSKHIELKYLLIQDEVKEGKLELKKVGTHFNPSGVLTKYVPASVLGQRLPHLSIFKVNSKRSSGKQVQYSPYPQLPSTSTITRRRRQSSCSPSTTMIIKKLFNSGSGRLQEVSKEFAHLLVEGVEIKEIQAFIVVIMSFIIFQKFKKVREREWDSWNQFNRNQVNRDQFRRNQESVAHGQQHPPPQNHESQDSMNQWRSWIRSCFSVSVSLSSASWRRRQDQGRNQEEINQRPSYHYLQVSRVVS